MEIGSSTLLTSRSGCLAWIPVALFVLLCWPLICCCCLVLAAAGWFVEPSRSIMQPVPELEEFPPVVTAPAIPTRTAAPGGVLNPDADPLFGTASLQPGFTPDPYMVEAQAGGAIDTSQFEQDCGFVSFAPAFTFDLGEGTSPNFLRIYFTPDDEDAETTLLVEAPDGDWLCAEGPTRGHVPILDLDPAPSGEYSLWIGTRQDVTPVQGSLSISGSQDVTP